MERGGAPPQTNLDPRSTLNSIGGIRIGSVIDQRGFGRYSERFEEFAGFQFSERFQKVLRRILEMIQTKVLEVLL